MLIPSSFLELTIVLGFHVDWKIYTDIQKLSADVTHEPHGFILLETKLEERMKKLIHRGSIGFDTCIDKCQQKPNPSQDAVLLKEN